jgi:hypothetical protein
MNREQFVELTSKKLGSIIVINVKHITHMNEYDKGVVLITTSIPTSSRHPVTFYVTESIKDIMVQIRCDK